MVAADTATERVELRHERLERKRMLRRQKAAATTGTNALTGESAATGPGSGNEISMSRQPAPATMQAIADSIATLDFQTVGWGCFTLGGRRCRLAAARCSLWLL